MDVDGGSEYVYAGGGELKRTDTPSADQQDAALKEISEATAALKEKCKAMKAKRWFKVGADSRTLSIGSKCDRRKEAVTGKSPKATGVCRVSRFALSSGYCELGLRG